ncbi:SCO6880 family protein [Saccharomonospora saliphila]|uniref:SCO6880 family protein n=1 Tax=Saccharomonospora saliphila TaxID=369829 RepID=UPI00035DFC90|nr:SCO6880 family protein [Saccharomonospora saliphila]
MTSTRIFRGLNRREQVGWVCGLTPVQALSCVALATPVVWAASNGRFGDAAVLLLVCGLFAVLVVVPVRGRPACRWLWHFVLYQVGLVRGWSTWQSKASAGVPVDPDEPDLPGVLQRFEFPDGPLYRDRGRVCLIHDTSEGRWGATARLTHTGVGMLSDEQCDQLASRLGTLLLSLGHRDVVDRLSLVVRTVPDDGTDYQLWRGEHTARDAPRLSRAVTDELDDVVGVASVRHEAFVTVSGPEDKLRRPAAAAGGGVAGRALALYRVLDGVEDPLKALGVQTVHWLNGAGMAEALRTGFNPAARASLTATHRHGAGGLEKAAAGPTEAPPPTPRAYTHDGFTTVSYTALMPESGTVFGSLGPLLAVRTPGERRTVAIHYEVLDARRAHRQVRSNRFRSTVLRSWKAGEGFTTTAADDREAAGARTQERAVAAGHSLVRFSVAASVTVPNGWNVEDHAARLENDASGRFRLLRMDLAQDSTFAVACLPIGLGLPRNRRGLS